MFIGIHHVAVVVRSVEKALGFYRDVLGLPVTQQAAVADQGVKAALLSIGGDEIELLEPTNPAGGVARFLEKKGEGIHHLCIETSDVAGALMRAKAAGLPLIDQAPRQGLAGTIGFLHPGACHGVLVEMAQPPQGAYRTPPAAGGIRATCVATIYATVKELAEATTNLAENFDAKIAISDRDSNFGVMRTQVQRGCSYLTLLDASELAAVPADDPFIGYRRDGAFGVCLAIADFANAERIYERRGSVSRPAVPSLAHALREWCQTAHTE